MELKFLIDLNFINFLRLQVEIFRITHPSRKHAYIILTPLNPTFM